MFHLSRLPKLVPFFLPPCLCAESFSLFAFATAPLATNWRAYTAPLSQYTPEIHRVLAIHHICSGQSALIPSLSLKTLLQCPSPELAGGCLCPPKERSAPLPFPGMPGREGSEKWNFSAKLLENYDSTENWKSLHVFVWQENKAHKIAQKKW